MSGEKSDEEQGCCCACFSPSGCQLCSTGGEGEEKTCCTKFLELCCPSAAKDEVYDSDDEKGKESEIPKEDVKVSLNFKNPNESRKEEVVCRVIKKRRFPQDILMTAIFVAFCIGMVLVAVKAFLSGDPRRLYMPTDYLGRVCGRDNSIVPPFVLQLPNDEDCRNSGSSNEAKLRCEEKVQPFKVDLSDRRFLWFMDMTNPTTYGGVCVSYCPGSRTAVSEETSIRFCPPELHENTTFKTMFTSGFEYCSFKRVDHNSYFPPTRTSQLIHSFARYTPVLRRCVPMPKFFNGTLTDYLRAMNESSAVISDIAQLTEGLINDAQEAGFRIWGDLYRAWRVLLISGISALVISFVFLLLIRIFTAVMVWVIVIACFFVLAGLGAFATWEGYTSRMQLRAQGLDETIATVVFGIGIGFCALAVIYVIGIIVFFCKISRAIAIIQEASRAVGTIPTLVVVPVGTTFLLLAFTTYWVIVAIFLWSAGYPTVSTSGFAVRYTLDNFTRGIFGYHIFGYLWVSNVMLAFEYTVVAGAVGSWYWRRDKRFRLKDPVFFSFIRTIAFQFGSVVLGSLVVSAIQFIRLIFERMYQKLKHLDQTEQLAKAIHYIVHAFIFIFELMIRFLNKHAYIQMALYGYSFFYSAQNAFFLISRHVLQLGILETVSNVVLMLGRITIGCATGILAYGLCKVPQLLDDDEAVSAPILIAALGFLMGIIIGSYFMSVLGCAIDTILQCFLIDKEMKASNEKYVVYGSKSLEILIEMDIAKSKAATCDFFALIPLGCPCCFSKKKDEFVDTSSPAAML